MPVRHAESQSGSDGPTSRADDSSAEYFNSVPPLSDGLTGLDVFFREPETSGGQRPRAADWSSSSPAVDDPEMLDATPLRPADEAIPGGVPQAQILRRRKPRTPGSDGPS